MLVQFTRNPAMAPFAFAPKSELDHDWLKRV